MDIKVSVKDGKDIELDGVTVINTLSVAEKEEKKEEPAPAPVPTVDVADLVNQQAVVGSTISSLDPTVPNIPNTEVSSVPTGTEVSADPSVNQTPSVESSTYSQGYDTANNNSFESVFKNADSVTASRNNFLDEVGKLFDERLSDPVNTSVIIANEAMELLDDVFKHGMNVTSFKKYQDLTDMYNGIKNVDEEDKSNDVANTFSSSNYGDYNQDNNQEDLSKMNIPRF